MYKTQPKRVTQLLLAAIIWGIAFVAQSVGMDYVEPFTFNGLRYVIGAIVLIPFVLYLRKKDPKIKFFNRDTLTAGIICGVLLFVSSSLQQIALCYTSPGKAGFITALYIIFVPIIGIAFGKKTGIFLILGAVLAVIGLYLLCITDGFSIQMGDLLLLACAIGFSFHIMTVDRFSDRVNGVNLSTLQFIIAGGLCLICMAIFESPRLSGITAAWIPLLYTGVLSCGVAYTFQILGQKGTNPVIASLLLSLESVFSVLADVILLQHRMTIREILGCVIMFIAIILAQLPSPRKKRLA